jgi:hypothetical protein
MSPEIDWQVQGDHGKEDIVHTLQPQAPRWRPIAIMLVIAIGVALGVIYRSIPEPPRTPTPTPTIVALPPLIAEVVDREVQALANGDKDAFLSIQDPNDASWYQAQADAFAAWGQAPATNPEYTVIETGTLADNRMWVDVRQWHGEFSYVRETRFYRLRDNRWLRTRPDVSFWSGQDARLSTTHFEVMYPKEDLSLAQIIVDRFERAYVAVCGDLHCEIGPTSRVLPQVLTMTLVLTQTDTFTTIDQGQYVTITFPSPRMLRIADRWGVPDDSIDAMAIDQLVVPVARIVSGGADRWFKSSDGVLFFNAIAKWERPRAKSVTSEFFVIDNRTNQLIRLTAHENNLGQSQQTYIDQLQDAQLVPLKALWSWPLNLPPDSSMFDTMKIEADAMIGFIQFRYKPDGVPRLLLALKPAQSLPEAIERSLETKYEDFEAEWLKWIGKTE